jgi:Integrase zinc binding domain/RNase H-like domain found in reverse transcriptase
LINDQGELAVIVEGSNDQYKFTGYCFPKQGGVFQKDEVRDVFLAQSMDNPVYEDKHRAVLSQYLETVGLPRNKENETTNDETRSIYKYKPVALKTRPVIQELPAEFRIKREIIGDPLAEMPKLSPNPPEFVPTGRYTEERKDKMDKVHDTDFLLPEERKLMHHFMMEQNMGFAWEDSERGRFREDFFPPIDMPVVPHKPWVLKNIPIPPGLYPKVCEIIKTKIDAGVYEPSNSAYRSRWFCVLKKDGVKLRLVHSLEPLNEVTIAHSGVPPATENLAAQFAGRACGAMFDLYVGYDERTLAERSRDLTTFQTPFGALRLVTLPMGWTNSVPIFHDDVTFILQPEIPEVTVPYIDDVPIKGPKSRYMLLDGSYEMIPENPGIRRFVWEHFQNLNRVVQRMKYCGGTFSGPKTVLCAEEITVVGHVCTMNGRVPETDRVGVIERWGALTTQKEVRQFIGVIGVCRNFIKDFAKIAAPLNHLLRKGVPFVWGPEHDKSMVDLKEALINSVPLGNIDYENDGAVVLAVDTSYQAVGYYIYQEDVETKQKKVFVKFGSITLKDREARFSQPKRELFGLKRALEVCEYLLIGCRKLIVETDAKYIHGMLNHPEMGPNATINRWIEKILMYHFELRHVPGISFGPDGLSRREEQPGDEQYPPDDDMADINDPPVLIMEEGVEPPLPFDDFKETIDTRGGYLQCLAQSVSCFEKEITQAVERRQMEGLMALEHLNQETISEKDERRMVMLQFVNQILLPDKAEIDIDENLVYVEDHRTKTAKLQDERLPLLKEWLTNPFVKNPVLDTREYRKLVRTATHFFLTDDGRLYRRGVDSAHKLVVDKNRRMYLMKASHDSLGHRGFYATKMLIAERFWWPEMERDISWYCKTCDICQKRQKLLVKIPPTVTFTPSIFQQLHADTMHMSPKSNGCGHITHGRCGFTSWMEGRPLKQETARAVGLWMFEDVICRWGSFEEVITDNSAIYKAAVAWLEQKYGITGIRISAYNSQANGKIERPHWDIRQMIYKATGGNPTKWFWFFFHIMWADRITVRKGLGCSPYFMITGAHPRLPLDIQEATWLVELPGRVLTTVELIAYRAQALAKHRQHVIEMRKRIDQRKRDWLARYERDNKATIKDLNFKPGDLVLVRNTEIESSLDKKMKARYNGPMIVVKRSRGGSYILAEMDGSVFQNKVGAFRVIPYFARRKLEIPEGILKIIDVSEKGLAKIESAFDEEDVQNKDYGFEGVNLRTDDVDFSEDETSDTD